jgi:hypothetical protein
MSRKLQPLNQSDYPLVIVKDLGMVFTGLYRSDTGKPRNQRKAIFKCTCGDSFTSTTILIKSKKVKSCGCLRKVSPGALKHGDHGTRLYNIWKGTKTRCGKVGTYQYIIRCKEWDDYNVFKSWALSNGYRDTLTIDRIDNTGNYEPSNCRWTTCIVQVQNRRVLTKANTSGFRGVNFNKGKWVARCGISYKRQYLGSYNTAEEAAKAFDTYVIQNNLNHNINGVLHEQLR